MPMEISPGDTAWVLTSAALVLLMTPGLAFFYGGMVRAKSVLNMLMMSFAAIAVVTVLWVLYGFSIGFGGDAFGGLVGDLSKLGLSGTLQDIAVNGGVLSIPTLAFAAFQLMFAIITVALVSGAIADRAKFGGWIAFVALWVTLVYFPVAHWVFYFGDADGAAPGWIAGLGVLDFAGGTAVHINAGAAALALALVLGRRVGWRQEAMKPHNLPLVVLGAALLWFGWFGFNAGSALGANMTAAAAFMTTQAATAAAVVGWLLVEKLRDGHATTLGAASGAVAGLVAITPAAAFVNPAGALVLGFVAGVLCAAAVSLKWKLGFDDSLDVVGVHLVGGLVGSLLIGLLATSKIGPVDGLFYGGGAEQLVTQLIGSLAVLAYSFLLSWLIGKVVDNTIGFRVREEDEVGGIDLAIHAETAYDFTALAGHAVTGRTPTMTSPAGVAPATERSVSA